MNPKLIALRTFAQALVMEPWDWINKITTDAERDFTRHANPRRVLALLDVAEAARSVASIAQSVPAWADSPNLKALQAALAKLETP